MFDYYKKKLEELQEDVPKIFERTAKKGAIKFVNEARKLTDQESLVDTGSYKRNWTAKAFDIDAGLSGVNNSYAVECRNNKEYASFLEEGYVVKKDYFVPFDKMEGTPRVKAFIAQFKSKYPNAKGFIRKAGRYKGKFIGRRAIDEAFYYCTKELNKAIEKAMKKK